MFRPSSLRQNSIRLLAALGIVFGAALPSGCGDLGGGFGGPGIDSASIEPQRVPASDRGMTDQCFTVNMTVSGVEAEIEKVTVFLVERSDQRATTGPGSSTECSPNVPARFQADGGSVTVSGILQSTLLPNNIEFGGQSEVDFGIGATIIDTEQTEVTQRNIATLTVFDDSQ